MASIRKAKTTYPCGKCGENCSTGMACVGCHMCEQWFHQRCIEGMNIEYFDNMKKSHDLLGWSGFLCKTCRRIVGKLNKNMKEISDKVTELQNQMVVMKMDRDTLMARIETLEGKAENAREGLKGVEEGMIKTKEEIKEEMRNDIREKEERSKNIVVYGVEESEASEGEQRKEDDKKQVEEMTRSIKVELGEFEVKFRAGKKKDDGKPRPMVVRIEEEEMRERILSNARKLAKTEKWRRVFVAPDMTWEQREDEKKKEK